MLCLGLAHESKELSKRMSVHAAHPAEDGVTSSRGGVLILANQTNPIATTDDGIVLAPMAPVSTVFSRKRTYSTPYPFESMTEPQYRGDLHHSKHSGGASGTARPSFTSSSPPSRIPKPSPRVGSSSKSSRHDGPAAQVTTLPDSGVSTSWSLLKAQTIPIDSSDKSESARPFKTKVYSEGLPASPESLNAVRASVQAEFEHWYRGEGREGGGRSGGRGEIRAGTQEMLAIALGGHANPECLSRESWMSTQRSYVDDGDYCDSHEYWGRGAWTEDYVLDERMLTDMEADGEATDGEVPGDTPAAPIAEFPNPQTPKSTVRQSKPPLNSVRAHLTAPAVPLRTQLPKFKTNDHTASTSSTSPRMRGNESRSTPRIRRKSSFPSTSGPSGSLSAHDLGSVSALADAVPFLESQPILPPSGNWDEVILPTVAKKMRMVHDDSSASVTMLGSTSKLHTGCDSTVSVPPAPGTFGYSPFKTRTGVDDPTSERGVTTLTKQHSRQTTTPDDVIPLPAPTANSSITGEKSSDQPIRQIIVSRKGAPNNKREVSVTSPSVKPRAVVDDESGGCCKCVVM